MGQALRDSTPGQASFLDPTPSASASIETDPTAGPNAPEADPLVSNKQTSAEIDRAGNDGRSQSEANRTIGQIVDIFA